MNESKPGRRAVALAIAAALCGLADSPTAFADTLPGALAQAYVNNPTLNAQRAALRATDEGVPIALSGYRPTVKGTIVAGSNDQFQTIKTPPTGAPGTAERPTPLPRPMGHLRKPVLRRRRHADAL